MTSWTRRTIPSSGHAIGRVRLKGWHRVTHGVHHTDVAVSEESLLQAWAETLPSSGAFTHLTAARLLGLWVPPGMTELPVTAVVAGDQWRPRRAGLRVFRLAEVATQPGPGGLPIATAAEVVLSCARHLAWLDLLVLVDSSLHLKVCTLEELSAVSLTRRRGARSLRAALEYAEPLTESAGETLLRMIHVLGDVPVVPQHPIIDATGQVLARADLWIRDTRRLPEYDGAYHRDAAQYERDRRRDRELQRAGWYPWSYSIHSVLRRPTSILRDADEALDRAFDPTRGQAFRAALALSC